MKVVVDTNVLISGIFFDGKPEEILRLCLSGFYSACVTDEIVAEYKRVIEEMQKRASSRVPKDAFEALNSFILRAEMFNSKVEIDVCRDSDDNKFIECAVSACAPYIISGDKDLLVLMQYDSIKILTAAQMLGIIGDS